MKTNAKLKVLKLSKDTQKKLVGGATRGSNCTPGETCVAAMDGYIISYYKRN